MGEHKQAQEASEPELNRPEDAIEDLELDKQDAEGVKGGTPITHPTDSASPNLFKQSV